MGDENPIRTLGDYSKPSHEGYRNTIELPKVNNMVPLRSDTIRSVQNGCSFHELWSEDLNQHLKDFLKLVDLFDLDVANRENGGKLRDRNAEESWALLEDLTLYDNKSWNDPRGFANPVKEISLSQDVPSTSDRRLIELENQVITYKGLQALSIKVNGKNAYELKRKFLDDLHNNAFSRTNEEDAVEPIEYFLKIVDPIDLPNVNQDKLRAVDFPISLVKMHEDGLMELKDQLLKLGSDKIEPTDLEETDHDDEQEISEIFRIETNLFDYETPLCKDIKEFNYLLKIDPDVLTKDIELFKTYDEYKDDWIYKWNKYVPWVQEKPWTDTGVWTEPTPVTHCCKPFDYKNGCSEWPICSWRKDGYCNRGNLLGAYIVGNTLCYQDLECWDDFENTNDDRNEWEYENDHEDDERNELCGDETHKPLVFTIRRLEMIKYSFGDDEEYVAVKENEYDDLTSTSEDACRAYQEIFRIMDEG
ncbi:hypothetical protein Tco_0862043 [Tanacetum coccineum]